MRQTARLPKKWCAQPFDLPAACYLIKIKNGASILTAGRKKSILSAGRPFRLGAVLFVWLIKSEYICPRYFCQFAVACWSLHTLARSSSVREWEGTNYIYWRSRTFYCTWLRAPARVDSVHTPKTIRLIWPGNTGDAASDARAEDTTPVAHATSVLRARHSGCEFIYYCAHDCRCKWKSFPLSLFCQRATDKCSSPWTCADILLSARYFINIVHFFWIHLLQLNRICIANHPQSVHIITRVTYYHTVRILYTH